MNHLRRGTRTHAVRVHAQQGHFPAFPKAAVWFTDRGYNVLLLPAGSMTTTSFLCCEKHFSVFRPLLYHGFCTASTPCRKFFRFFTKSKSARRYFSYHQALLLFFRGYSAVIRRPGQTGPSALPSPRSGRRAVCSPGKPGGTSVRLPRCRRPSAVPAPRPSGRPSGRWCPRR